MELEKREIISFRRKDTFKIPGSSNKLICERGVYYIVTQKGEVISQHYNRISDFVDGRAVFCDKGVGGIIDANGKIIFKRDCDYMGLDANIVRICIENKWGLNDLNGKEICKPQYSFIEKFSNGLARIITEDKFWGIINNKGRLVIKPKYKYLGNPDKPLIVAKNVYGYGVIDIKENVIEPFKYKKIRADGENIAIFNTDCEICTEQYILNV